MITWRTEQRRVRDLIPYEKNPRVITEEQQKHLTESLQKFNLVEISAITKDNIILAGHMRVKTLALLGRLDDVIDVRVPDRNMSKEEIEEYNVRSNKNTADWDNGMLAGFDEELLKNIGFSNDELSRIYDADVQEDGFDVDAEYAKITEAETKLGDMYEIGNHRLLCGDSTKHDHVARLMGGSKADMVFTDPPYNVNYNYAKYEAIGRNRKSKFKNQGKIFNDNKSSESFQQFIYDTFTNIYMYSKPSMAIYCCHATKTQSEFFNAFHDAGFHFSQTIIWLKERMILAMGQDYHRIYEPIMFGWKEGEKHYSNKLMTKEREVWDLDRISFEERLDVWYINRDKSSEYEHPTQKPVKLPERAIKKNCPIDGMLFEPFGGSGSTMMACEQLRRKCYSIELDPKYCDVIVKRWERFTGKKAVKQEEKDKVCA